MHWPSEIVVGLLLILAGLWSILEVLRECRTHLKNIEAMLRAPSEEKPLPVTGQDQREKEARLMARLSMASEQAQERLKAKAASDQGTHK